MAVLYDSTIWSDYQVSQKDLVLFGGVWRQRKEKKYIYTYTCYGIGLKTLPHTLIINLPQSNGNLIQY